MYAKALRIVNNPKFMSLPDQEKQAVLGNYYKKYVSKAYMNTDQNPPDEATWIRGMSVKGGPSMNVSDFYVNRGQNADAASDLYAGVLNMGNTALRTVAHIIRGTVNAGIAVDKSAFGLDKYFTGTSDNTWKNKLANLYMRAPQATLMRESQDAIDSSDFWFASRPSKSFTEVAGSFIGEQGIQLPLYRAIGVLGTLGAKAAMLDKALEVGETAADASKLVKAANFTRRLAATPQGRFVGRRLKEVADAYIGDALQDSYQDRHGDAALFVGLGMLGEIPGGLRRLVISKAVQKKAMAEAAAIGGLPFREAINDEAEHQLKTDTLGHDHSGNPVKAEPGDTKEVLKQKMDAVHDADPVKTSLTTATKLTFNAVAQELYGPSTVYKNLGKRKQDAVRTVIEHRGAQATEEMPIHVPEVQKHEIEKGIKEDIELSPQLAKTYSELDQKFPVRGGTAGAVANAEDQAIRKKTGLTSVQKAVKDSAEKNAARIAAGRRASGKPKPGPRTREDEIFSDFSDFGTSKYNYKDDSFNLQFESKADRALYNTRKTPLQYTGANKEVPPTYHATKAKLKQFFPGKTDAEIQIMANQVKERADAAVKERKAHPDYKSGKMKYGANIRIPSIHGTKETIMEKNKQDIKDYASDMAPLKEGFPEAYKQGLDTLVQLQAVTNIIDIGKE